MHQQFPQPPFSPIRVSNVFQFEEVNGSRSSLTGLLFITLSKAKYSFRILLHEQIHHDIYRMVKSPYNQKQVGYLLYKISFAALEIGVACL
jgi:hypothetical protein